MNEFLMVVKGRGEGSCWCRDERCLGAFCDSFFDPLVLAFCAVGFGAGADVGRDLVALGDDGSALVDGDRLAVEVAELVGVWLRRQDTIRVRSTVAIVQVAELWWRPVSHIIRW